MTSFIFMLFLCSFFNLIYCELGDQQCAKPGHLRARIAVAFYGLSRALDITLPTFKRHVFDVLSRQQIAFDVFWSSLAVIKVDNPRSGEQNLIADPADFALMKPCVISVISQSVVVPVEYHKFIKSRAGMNLDDHDPYKDGFTSVRNLLGAFHSMRTLDSMITVYARDKNITYDAILVLRPDTAVIVDIDILDHIDEIKHQHNSKTHGSSNESIWVPDFEHYGGYNDRAAYGSPHVMSLYLQRGTAFRDEPVARDKRPNGETFLKDYMISHQIYAKYSKLRLLRIRADKSIAPNDLSAKLLNLQNQSFEDISKKCFIVSPQKHFLNTTSC